MTDSGLFMAHWVDIDPERMERYETMYQWSEAAEAFYAPAGIGEGQVVADFGCGPGHAAIEFARRVEPSGHVHALDINAEFIARTHARARKTPGSRAKSRHICSRARTCRSRPPRSTASSRATRSSTSRTRSPPSRSSGAC
jgi:SAM-dependent methyltransferase